MEALLVPLLSAVIGWSLRHFGIIAPAEASPQTRTQTGGVVPPAGIPSGLPSMIQAVVGQEVKKVIAYLESRLPASLTAPAAAAAEKTNAP